MAKANVSSEWLKKAENDLALARLAANGSFFDWAQLACQQSAEKALKAVCISKGIGLIKTHELISLAMKAGAPKEIVSKAGFLNSFYFASRYPDAVVDMGKDSLILATNQALENAEGVILWSKQQVKT